MKRLSIAQRAGLPIFVAILSASCGDAHFSDGTGGAKVQEQPKPRSFDQTVNPPPAEVSNTSAIPTDPTPTPVAPDLKATSLTWFWACDSDPSAPPKPATSKDLVVSGPGPHGFPTAQLSDVPIQFRGKVCPVDVSRDIVFIVDVSGSMQQAAKGNDAKKNGTCNRLEAVKRIIDSSGGANGGKFSIVTFSDDVVFASTSFSGSLNGALQGQDMATVLCAANGGTNYKAPLVIAQNLFTQARKGSSKEIYFVSDGLPDNDGTENQNDPTINGKNESASLRAGGVVIATAMLGNNAPGDTYMRTFISSSIKQTGQPDVVLHASITNTTDLTRALNQLADNSIVTGTLNYRSVGSTDWQSVNLMTYKKEDEFILPALRINDKNAPNGLEIQFQYEDRRGNGHSGSGMIVWSRN